MIHRFLKTIRLHTDFADADEREFCDRWMRNIERHVFRSVVPVSMMIDVAVFLLAPAIAHWTNVPYMRLMHGIHFAVAAAAWFVIDRTKPMKAMAFVGTAIYAVGYGYVCYRCHAEIQNSHHWITGATAFLAVCFVNQQANGFDKRTGLLYLGFCLGVAVLAMGTSAVGPVWLGISGFLLSLSCYFHLGRVQRALDEAVREFRLRRKIAPAHIVRKTSGGEQDLGALFQPQKQRSICISSDWRNYQKLSEKIDPKQLGLALNGYYDICYELLRQAFPQGNYYTDWIADELFIVIFLEAHDNEKQMVNQALRFAESLIRGKETFRKRYGLPAAIDVGVSTGSALIGMMGPEGFRKATALGEIPGRARRLQSAGKLLRSRLGEADRVVFDQDVLMQISEAFDIKTYEAAPDHLRDLPFSTLFFVEPAAEVSASAPESCAA